MNRKLYKQCIETEVYGPHKRETGRLTFFDKIWCRYFAPYSNSVYMIRRMHYLYSRRWGKIFAKLIHAKLTKKYGITIPISGTVGIGLSIPHPSSITIASIEIGENFRIYQNTTIGRKRSDLPLFPKIGNNVTLYANSSIIGAVTVGDGVLIGAHSCLLHDAPEAGTYIGVPAKKVR